MQTEQSAVGYVVVACPGGWLLVGRTVRGVCTVGLGESEAALVADVAGRYTGAVARPDDADLVRWAGLLVAFVRGEQRDLDVPLDVAGTPFQEQVWAALRAIPYGETRSYGDVARAMGRPRAVRAVAQACGANPVPLVVPCHRVVRSDGGLGGFRGGGVERKRALLAMEGAATAG